MNLQDLNPASDCRIYNYDLQKHDWPEFWLKVAKEKFPNITSLETVHKVLTASEIVELGRHCQNYCSTTEFADRVDKYYSEIVDNYLGFEDWMVQRYFTIRIVIPNQAKVGRLLTYHQGIWVGNGLGLRTIWTPFTKAYGNNTMWMVDWDNSKKITQDCYTYKWDYDKLQEECVKHAQPAELDPGQTIIFQQHHIHGNFNNDTDITRWSMDGRILPKGGHYHRKLPGGYFRFIGEREDSREINEELRWVSYAGWNSKFSYPIPLPMQRSIIDQYCKKYNISINDYQFENETLDWQPSLEKIIKDFNIEGIVLCSIYCLPDDISRRREILVTAIENNVELHFANELCSVRNEDDLKHIEEIFKYVNENTDPNIYLGYTTT